MRRLLPLLARRALPIAIALGLAAIAAVALAQVGGPSRARAEAVAGSGSFEITDSHDGAPIFAAVGIAPGESTSGTVTIEDAGSEAIALELRRGELDDTPGFGGGILSGRLQLTVADVTGPGAPRDVYSGPLDSMPGQTAGELQGGEARTYEFTATLPDGGSASFQNAVQGAATTIAYSWVAVEARGGEGKEEEENDKGGEDGGGSGGGGTGSPGAPSPTPPARGGGDVGPQGNGAVLNLTVPKVKGRLRHGHLVIWTNCDFACRLTIKGRIRATASGNHRRARIRFRDRRLLAPGVQRLRVPVPAGLLGWLRRTPGKARFRASLRFLAVGTEGERDVARRTVSLLARPQPGPPPAETPPS